MCFKQLVLSAVFSDHQVLKAMKKALIDCTTYKEIQQRVLRPALQNGFIASKFLSVAMEDRSL